MNRDASYWAEVEAIFQAAADLDKSSRLALLDARCAGRATVRRDIELLLATDAAAGGSAEPASPPGQELRGAPGVGSTIGQFYLVEAIGTGGMAIVYRGERTDAEFAQQVAVKVITTPMTDADAARRFRAERQILATLRHPHIVSLLDGGVTPDGYAYLVMEYVDGVSVTRYCEEHRLSLPDRLELFRSITSAVHYAHRHLVVHRDLKPANILVTADGVPKVLDFGVAKMLDSRPQEATATSLELRPLTPNYASPEQLRGLAVTSSSDVYALGVLLYELVAGRRPYDTEDKPLDEVMRLVAEQDPARPSTVARSDCLPYSPRTLRGDLDAIVLRAMAKTPDERFGSAEEMSEDIRRFLTGVPIVAQEPSLGYVARKLAIRHKGAFISIGVSLVFIMAALVAAVWQARVASVERQRAESRFAEVRQLANALIFEIHDAVAPLPGSTPVRRTIVERALKYLEGLASEAQGDDALQVELANAYTQIGKVQGLRSAANLGDPDGAIASLRRAQALLDPVIAAPLPSLAAVEGFVEATRRLSEVLSVMPQGQAEAISQAQRAVTAAEAYRRRAPQDVKARNMVASSIFTAAIATRWPDWLPHWKRAGELYQGLLAERPEDPQNLRNVALVEKYLGAHYEMNKDLAQALVHYERARKMDERRLTQDASNRGAQLDVAIDLANEANIYRRQQELRRAAEMYEKSLAIRQAIATSDPKDGWAQTRVGYVHGQLALVHERAGNRDRALEHSRTAAVIYAARPSRDVADGLEFTPILWMLAWQENAAGRRDRACQAYAESFRVFDRLPADLQRRLEGDLPDAARAAAACGLKAAEAWLSRPKTKQ